MATLAFMLAANNIWHWWIGVLLTLGAVLVTAGLIAAYLKSVTSQHYPGKRQRRED